MTNLEYELSRYTDTLSSGFGSDSVSITSGTIQFQGGVWVLYVGGIYINGPIWNQGLYPYAGAQCIVLLGTKGNASFYYVMAIADSQPNAGAYGTVTAFTGGQPTCTVTAANGVSYTANRLNGYTPTVNDTTLLLFAMGKVWAIGNTAAYTPPPLSTPAPVPPVPARPPVSSSTFVAQDSGTWVSSYGGWYDPFGQDLYTGSGWIPTSTASWFYNGTTLGVSTKTLTRIQLYVPARLQKGDYQNPTTIHVWTHSSTARGITEPTRVDGPFDLTVPAYWAGGYMDIPLSGATTIKNGGGISIAGDPYVGLTGVALAGNSGALKMDWSN